MCAQDMFSVFVAQRLVFRTPEKLHAQVYEKTENRAYMSYITTERKIQTKSSPLCNLVVAA